MKRDRSGQATPFKKADYLLLRRHCKSRVHELFFDLAWYTAERPGAILRLQVSDVYMNARTREVRKQITFNRQTRKGGDTRQVYVSDELRLRLQAASVNESGFLFPSELADDRHLTMRAMDRAFRRIVERAGRGDLGYSLYSFRRGALTTLRNSGYDISVIRAFSGHKSLTSLVRYLDIGEQQLVAIGSAL